MRELSQFRNFSRHRCRNSRSIPSNMPSNKRTRLEPSQAFLKASKHRSPSDNVRGLRNSPNLASAWSFETTSIIRSLGREIESGEPSIESSPLNPAFPARAEIRADLPDPFAPRIPRSCPARLSDRCRGVSNDHRNESKVVLLRATLFIQI